MNTIIIRVEIIPEKREEFLQTIRSLHEQIKKEKGFRGSDVFQDLDNHERFNLIQHWETQDDLDNHTRSENFRILMGALKVLAEHSEVRYNLVLDRFGRKILDIEKETE